jgi:hypothetical protein
MELGRPTAGLFHSMSRNLRCPLWVISRHCTTSKRCLLYPQKWTLVEHLRVSALCQKQTYAMQPNAWTGPCNAAQCFDRPGYHGRLAQSAAPTLQECCRAEGKCRDGSYGTLKKSTADRRFPPL